MTHPHLIGWQDRARAELRSAIVASWELDDAADAVLQLLLEPGSQVGDLIRALQLLTAADDVDQWPRRMLAREHVAGWLRMNAGALTAQHADPADVAARMSTDPMRGPADGEEPA
jgi:hypothetical protein